MALGAQTRISPSCPAEIQQASDRAAQQGLDIFSGRYAAEAMAEPNLKGTLTENGLTLHLSQSSETSGVMVATVAVPGQAHPVVLWLGLAGAGLTARGIVDSIHPATS